MSIRLMALEGGYARGRADERARVVAVIQAMMDEADERGPTPGEPLSIVCPRSIIEAITETGQ